MPADPIADLTTTGNALSVWIMDTETQLAEVAAGFCVDKQEIEKVDFLIVDADAVEAIGIEIKEVDGKLPIARLNSFHRDLVGLTAQQLIDLAMLLYSAAKPLSMPKQRNVQTMKNLIKQGDLIINESKPKLLKQLGIGTT